VTANDFIFSNAHPHRLMRHVTFWGVFGLMYYTQSVVPIDDPFYVAWVSFSCFFPACILSVYFFLFFLLPLAKKKRYGAFFMAMILIICFVIVLNYYGSVLFFHFTCNCDVLLVDRWKIVGLDLNNSQHAISTAGLIFGFRVGKHWIAGQKVSRDLLNLKVTNELKFEKTRLHPRFTLELLSQIREKIDSGSSDGPQLILRLSEILSYLLYDSPEEKVSLKHEIEMTENLLYLEQQRAVHIITHSMYGETGGKFVKPLLLFSPVRKCLELFRAHGSEPLRIRFEISSGEDDQLHLDIGMRLPHGPDELPSLTAGLNAIKNRLITARDQNNLKIALSYSFN
jgi:two-component system, LytTR family, sensor kinase